MNVYYAYSNGNLEKALQLAAEFVARRGENCMTHIFTTYDEQLGWTVNVLYDEGVPSK